MMTRVSCGLLVFQVFRYTWSSGGKVYRVRSVGVCSTWLPYSLTASMVSPTWRTYLSYSISRGLRCPFFWARGMGLSYMSSNALNSWG